MRACSWLSGEVANAQESSRVIGIPPSCPHDRCACKVFMERPNAKVVSEGTGHMSQHRKSHAGNVFPMLISQPSALQGVMRHCYRSYAWHMSQHGKSQS